MAQGLNKISQFSFGMRSLYILRKHLHRHKNVTHFFKPLGTDLYDFNTPFVRFGPPHIISLYLTDALFPNLFRSIINCSRNLNILSKIYVSLRLRVQNAVLAQPCVGNLEISLVLFNFLHCNLRLWFKTP